MRPLRRKRHNRTGIRTFPSPHSNAVTTDEGATSLAALFVAAIFGRPYRWTGLQKKRWHGARCTTSFARDAEGNRQYTHARY